MSELPPFDEAVQRVRAFLDRQGLCGEIAWVFKEDISTKLGGRVWVRLPLPKENADTVRRLYESARGKQTPVELAVFCRLGPSPCCYLFVPETRLDAEQRMIYGFKMIIPTEPREARPLGRNLLNHFLHVLQGRVQPDWWLDEVPSRSRAVQQLKMTRIGHASQRR